MTKKRITTRAGVFNFVSDGIVLFPTFSKKKFYWQYDRPATRRQLEKMGLDVK